MGRKYSPAEIQRMAESVSALVGQGVDVVTAYSQARIAAAGPGKGLVALEREQLAATARHEKAMRKHQHQTERKARSAVTLGATSVAAGVVGAVVFIPGAAFAGGALLATSAVTFVMAVRARWDATHTGPPPILQRAASASAAAATLRPESIGWPETNQLIAVRRQIVGLVPAITALHPEAGRELHNAEQEAGPVLTALVTRLGLLDQVRRDLPGTAACEAATISATEIANRLGWGVRHYEQLLAAGTRLLGAPDIARSTDEVLGPAAEALTAYAHGLRVAAGG